MEAYSLDPDLDFGRSQLVFDYPQISHIPARRLSDAFQVLEAHEEMQEPVRQDVHSETSPGLLRHARICAQAEAQMAITLRGCDA